MVAQNTLRTSECGSWKVNICSLLEIVSMWTIFLKKSIYLLSLMWAYGILSNHIYFYRTIGLLIIHSMLREKQCFRHLTPVWRLQLKMRIPLGSRKKTLFFLVARQLRPYRSPLELSGHKNFSSFFLELQKTVFLLSGQALTPPPLSGWVTKKRPLFFCGFPNSGAHIRSNPCYLTYLKH